MAKSSNRGGRSLKKYERNNLIFFLSIIVVLGVLVSFVFNHYKAKNQEVAEDSNGGVISDSLGDSSDVGAFYLGTSLSETSHQYRSRLDIPVTDDGLLRDLFDLPGVEEITLNQKMILMRKNSSTSWESIRPGVKRIVKQHLHIHF